VNKKKHFAKKFTNEDIKLACNVKLEKSPRQLAKNIKFTKSMKTMEIPHDNTNMRSTTLLT